MPYLIGTDEAGYGPNLGPLVIAASVWRVPGDPRQCDPYELLRGTVAKSAADTAQDGRLAIADSKALYKPGQGLRLLERGVLGAVAALGHPATSSRELWRALDPIAFSQFDALPWHVGRELPLPLEIENAELISVGSALSNGFAQTGAQLIAICVSTAFPAKFNLMTDDFGSKGETLSRLTLALIARALEFCDGGPVHIVCDKHGGRGKYQRLLQLQFPDPLIEVLQEGLAESVYRWGARDDRIEICFRAKGESFLPAALASMTAKYLRELTMREFNAFWQTHVLNLRPTAGYPVDALRFKREIAHVQAALGIEDDLLWRKR